MALAACHDVLNDDFFVANGNDGERNAQYKCKGADLFVCNAGRTDFVKSMSCATPALCSATEGVCKAAICSPNQTICNGDQLLLCNAAQTGWDTQAICVSQELCDPIKKTCYACLMGQYRCTGQVLERCKGDRMGFDVVKTCAANSQCSATGGDCVGGSSDGGTTDARSD